MANKPVDDVLRALLDTELKPEKDVTMRRFGVNFHIQALDGRVINQIREQASVPGKGGTKSLDEEAFGALVIEKACVVPNWRDPALLEKFGPTPVDAVQKRLLAGEIAYLTAQILDLSGFDDGGVDEIKN